MTGVPGFNIIVRSFVDMAADRLWAWPRLPPGGPGAAGAGSKGSSHLPGEVDSSPKPGPDSAQPSPPTNSFVALLWALARAGMVRACGLSGGDCMPNEKAGRELRLLASKLLRSIEPIVIDVADRGLRPVDLLKDEGAEDGDTG